jgi:DNA mismatch repair protein MutS2
MEFDQSTLQPTFRFKTGVPGSSYAIEMAERIQMSKEIINRAKALRGTDANQFEDLIIELERRTQALQGELDTATAEKNKYTELNKLYQTKITSLEKEVKDIKLHAIHEAEVIVQRANAAIEKTVQVIKERGAERDAIKNAREEIKSITHEFDHLKGELGVPATTAVDYDIGDFVRLRHGHFEGEVISKIDEHHYTILIGALKVKVHRKEIEQSIQKSKKTLTTSSPIDLPISEVQQEIDLRGMYGDEAIKAVEKFFDQAVLSGLHQVNLIHGKGTGALRHKINEYLKNNKNIKSFRLGEWNEGGTGVTIVELQ